MVWLSWLLPLVVPIVGAIFRHQRKMTRAERLRALADDAFQVVEVLAGQGRWKGSEKLSEFFGELNAAMAVERLAPLTEAERAEFRAFAARRSVIAKGR